MRKDQSTESEFIQGGSHDDANAIAHANNCNLVENTAAGDCDSTNAAMAKKPSTSSSCNDANNTIARLRSEQRQEDQSLNVSDSSLPLLSCLSSDSGCDSAVEEEPSSAAAVSKPKTTTKSVGFSHCSIRSYNQILGDHPLCAVGCPIALGWKVMGEETFSVQDFECLREPLRKKKGAKAPLQPQQHQRKQLHRHSYEDGQDYNEYSSTTYASMEPCLKYLNSQLKLSAHERRDRLRDYNDAQIRKEFSRMQKQSRRGLINEGRRQFRQVGSYYAGY